MSDLVRCDVCGDLGPRRHFKAVPEGWLYREVKEEDTGHVFIVGVCSRSCAAKFWQREPSK
jgi:hypothetical protein